MGEANFGRLYKMIRQYQHSTVHNYFAEDRSADRRIELERPIVKFQMSSGNLFDSVRTQSLK